ncbi:MAG: divergent polysaccharide deacetylase family protein [Candidatus Omnitrophota bacterium]
MKKSDYSRIAVESDQKIARVLAKNNIDPAKPISQTKQIQSGFRKQAVGLKKEFDLPSSASIDAVKTALINDVDFSPAKIVSIKKTKTSKENILTLDLDYQHLKVYSLILKQKPFKGKIAIVLDDWGYNQSMLEPALSLKTPITYALLPNLPYSRKIAQALDANGDEIILHLPLEPHNAAKHPLEKNTILTTMSKQEVIDITLNDLNSLPNLRGINNHMGSKATEDENVMEIIFDIIKSKNLYFLDSYTSNQSALAKVAVLKNVVFFKRDVFLDDKNDKESIKQQLIKTTDLAQQTGMAIAIGHAKSLTIETLAEMIPLLEKQGYEFVYLSQLISKQETE